MGTGLGSGGGGGDTSGQGDSQSKVSHHNTVSGHGHSGHHHHHHHHSGQQHHHHHHHHHHTNSQGGISNNATLNRKTGSSQTSQFSKSLAGPKAVNKMFSKGPSHYSRNETGVGQLPLSATSQTLSKGGQMVTMSMQNVQQRVKKIGTATTKATDAEKQAQFIQAQLLKNNVKKQCKKTM